MTMNRPRLLLADDHTMFSQGLQSLLEDEFDLVGAVADGHALVEAARRLNPDVIIVGTPSTDDDDRPLSVLSRWPKARVMVVTPTEGEAALSELRLHTTELGRVSPGEIVQSILDIGRQGA